MENEQAQEAVPPIEAASVEGAGNEKEQAMSSLLEQMTGGTDAPPEEAPEAAAAENAAPEEEEEKKAKNFRGRWDHLNEQERRVVELTTKRGLTLTEAYRAVYGENEAPASAAAVPDTLDREIAEQEARVEELKRLKAEAKGDLQEYDKAAEGYLEARERLHALRSRRQSVAEQEAARAQKTKEEAKALAGEALRDEYPDALVPGTELYQACREEMAYLAESKSPLLNDPQAEYKVARRLARVMGYAARAGQTDKEEAIAPRRTVRPVPVGGLPVETPLATLERRVAGARSTGAILDLMREIGTPFEALLKKG